jgi:hypothetical protein
MFADFGSAECRAIAEATFALAERGGVEREQRLVDAARWMLLAERLDFLETSLAAAARANKAVRAIVDWQ